MLSSIIRSQQRRRSSVAPSVPQRTAPRRGFFLTNTMTRPRTRRAPPNPNPNPPPSTPPASPDILSIPIFSTRLEENLNRSNYFDTSNYYSLFQYNDLNIRYYHNNWIQEQESFDIVNSIVQYIADAESTPFLDDAPPSHQNDIGTIQLIREKTQHANYKDLKHSILNDQCPILLTPFEDNTRICFFKNCLHALDASVVEQFTSTFKKCPLCNDSLV